MNALPPDPWKALGIEKTADKGDIRTAYRKLVLKCHPDKVQDPMLKALKQDEFQKVQQAYELLNDDVERKKYEDRVQLAELRKRVAEMAKNTASTSASRQPATTSKYYTHEVRAAEPKSTKSGLPPMTFKVYSYSSTHYRSHQEIPTRTFYEEDERRARRAARHEPTPKSSKRDDERREKEEKREKEDRRRRKEEREARDREYKERESEKEREAIKAEKRRIAKQLDKEKEKQRKYGIDEMRRPRNVYVDEYEDPNLVHSAKADKKRTESKDKSSSSAWRVEREESPRRPVAREVQAGASTSPHEETFAEARSYIEKSRGPGAIPFRTAPPRPEISHVRNAPKSTVPVVPSPPDSEDDAIARAPRDASNWRTSREAFIKTKSTSAREFANIVNISPRPPPLQKSYTTPLGTDPSPRGSRTQTISAEEYEKVYEYSRPISTLARNSTWAPGDIDRSRPVVYAHEDYADFSYFLTDDKHHRRSRHHRSPDTTSMRYKVEGYKISEIDVYYGSSRKYAYGDGVDNLQEQRVFGGFRVKESKAYDWRDVNFSDSYYPPETSATYA